MEDEEDQDRKLPHLRTIAGVGIYLTLGPPPPPPVPSFETLRSTLQQHRALGTFPPNVDSTPFVALQRHPPLVPQPPPLIPPPPPPAFHPPSQRTHPPSTAIHRRVQLRTSPYPPSVSRETSSRRGQLPARGERWTRGSSVAGPASSHPSASQLPPLPPLPPLHTSHRFAPPPRVSTGARFSCAACRKHKKRCDGLRPCQRCTHRRIPCREDEGLPRSAQPAPPPPPPPSTSHQGGSHAQAVARRLAAGTRRTRTSDPEEENRGSGIPSDSSRSERDEQGEEEAET